MWRNWFADKSQANLDALMAAYERLVSHERHRSLQPARYNQYLSDLYQEGQIALLDAIRKYRRDARNCFSTYAILKIRGAMKDWSRAAFWPYRRLGSSNGAQLSRQQVPYLFYLDGEHLDDYRARPAETDVALNAADDPQLRLDRTDWWHRIATIARADKRETLILWLYYVEGCTHAEIGSTIGLGESRASQLHSQLLVRLRGHSAELSQLEVDRPKDQQSQARKRIEEGSPIADRRLKQKKSDNSHISI